MKIKYLILAMLLILSCLLPFVSADLPPPGFPHEFRGEVLVNGDPAPDGTLVSAEIEERNVHSNEQNPVETVNGNYGIDFRNTSLLVQGSDLVNGDIIKFYVNGVDTGETYNFQSEGGPTWMNLSVTIDPDPDPDPDPGPGPGPTPDPDPDPILPVADAGGPYEGYVGFSILFTGEDSSHPDPNGTIVGYRWDYTDDGSWDTDWLTSPTTSHVYEEAGNYTLRLQVKDNDDATDTDTTTVTVDPVVAHPASNETLADLLDHFGLNLTEPFQVIDTTGDGVVDTFVDPNDLIYFIRSAIVDGDDIYLLATQDDDMPEFFWNPVTDEIVPVTSTTAEVPEPVVDEEAKEIIFEITVEKADWIYIKLIDSYPPDQYPDFTLTVTTADGRVISPDFIWREDGFIYVLDDPETQYVISYGYDELPSELQPPDDVDDVVDTDEDGLPWLFIIIGIIAAIIILLVILVKTGYIFFEDEEK